MKSVAWVSDSRSVVRAFPDEARQRAGRQLACVQDGLEPDDWKPMQSVGIGAREIRVHARGEKDMTERMKIERSSGNVFRDIGFRPARAHNLLLRSEMMTRIEQFVKRSDLTQKDAARLLGITQPRLNDLLKGRIDKFSLDALVNMLGHAKLRVEIKIKKMPLRKAA